MERSGCDAQNGAEGGDVQTRVALTTARHLWGPGMGQGARAASAESDDGVARLENCL